MSELYNIEIEKGFLSCIIQYPDSLAEVSIINEKDFSPINGAIFKIISNEINKGKEVSTILLADKIKGYNIQLEGVDAYDYLEALKLLPINEKEIESLAKQLKKLSVLREYEEIGKNIVKKARSSQSEEFVDIVNGMDKMFNEKVNNFSNSESQPVDLFQGIEELVESNGVDPREKGVICKSFPLFYDFYGSFRNGGLYSVVARAKNNKTSFLLSLGLDAIETPENGNLKVLFINTELSDNEMRMRVLSSITNINEHYLFSGLWRKNADMVKKVRDAYPTLNKMFNRIDHIYVGGKPFSEVLAISRRWFHKNVSRFSDCRAMIIYDYIKLGAEMTANAKEYIVVGQKVDQLKQLAQELDCPIITAAQANRSGEGRTDSSKIVEDGSVVGLSDMINTLSNGVWLLRKLTIDEKIKYGEDFTHTLKALYNRNLGRDLTGTNLVKYLDEKGKIMYENNFIRVNMNGFKAEEKGDLRQYMADQGRLVAKEYQIQQEKKEGLF
jgi:replicative DNA helicase